MKSSKLTIAWIISGILFVLLFVGGPDHNSIRSFRTIWDLGHILFFAILNCAILKSFTFFRTKTLLQKILWVSFISLFLGITTEFVQIGLNRTADLFDVSRDFIGGLIPVLFQSATKFRDLGLIMKAARITLALIILIYLVPFLSAATDEFLAWREFPVLANFESPFEIGRWYTDLDIAIDHELAFEGKSSLKVPLTTDEFSGLSLKYFPTNWDNYSRFNMNIYNPLDDTLTVEFRIHDLEHALRHQPYPDRFNTSFNLSSGWNTLSVDLERVARAPKDRAMNMKDIRAVGIFVTNLPKPVTIRLDNIYLSN